MASKCFSLSKGATVGPVSVVRASSAPVYLKSLSHLNYQESSGLLVLKSEMLRFTLADFQFVLLMLSYWHSLQFSSGKGHLVLFFSKVAVSSLIIPICFQPPLVSMRLHAQLSKTLNEFNAFS